MGVRNLLEGWLEPEEPGVANDNAVVAGETRRLEGVLGPYAYSLVGESQLPVEMDGAILGAREEKRELPPSEEGG